MGSTSSDFDLGTSDSSQLSTELADHLDQRRHDFWATKPSKATLSTESEDDEVAESVSRQRVPPTVSQCTRSSDETQTCNGSPSQSTSTESSRVSPVPARSPEASARVTDSPRPSVAPDTKHGSDETPSSSTERGKLFTRLFGLCFEILTDLSCVYFTS